MAFENETFKERYFILLTQNITLMSAREETAWKTANSGTFISVVKKVRMK